MKIVFPVVFRDQDEADLLLAPGPDGPLAARAWRSLARVQGEAVSPTGSSVPGPATPDPVCGLTAPGDVLVVSNHSPVLTLAREHGLTALELPGLRLSSRKGLLPPGAAQALRLTLAAGLLAPGDPAAVLDCRHPLLDLAALALARETHGRDPARVVLDVAPSEDHPIQLWRHLRLDWAEALIPLDPAFRPGGGRPDRLATRPRPFDWPFYFSERGFRETPLEPGEVVLASHADCPGKMVYLPLEVAGAFDPALFRRRACYHLENLSSARRLLPPAPALPPPWRAAFGPFSAEDGELPALAARHGRTGDLGLFVRRELVRPGLVLRVAGHGPGREEMRETVLRAGDISRAEGVDWDSGVFVGPLARFRLGPDREWLSVAALAPVGPGAVDLRLPLRPGPDLWRRLPSTLQAVNAATGEVVSGRQQFPPVFEPGGALALGRVRDLLALARGREVPLRGVELPRACRCRVDCVVSALGLGLLLRDRGKAAASPGGRAHSPSPGQEGGSHQSCGS